MKEKYYLFKYLDDPNPEIFDTIMEVEKCLENYVIIDDFTLIKGIEIPVKRGFIIDEMD